MKTLIFTFLIVGFAKTAMAVGGGGRGLTDIVEVKYESHEDLDIQETPFAGVYQLRMEGLKWADNFANVVTVPVKNPDNERELSDLLSCGGTWVFCEATFGVDKEQGDDLPKNLFGRVAWSDDKSFQKEFAPCPGDSLDSCGQHRAAVWMSPLQLRGIVKTWSLKKYRLFDVVKRSTGKVVRQGQESCILRSMREVRLTVDLSSHFLLSGATPPNGEGELSSTNLPIEECAHLAYWVDRPTKF